MVRQRFKIEGLRELDSALADIAAEIGPKRGREPLRKALQDVAKPIAEKARELAPEADTPYYVYRLNRRPVLVNPGGLKRTIKVGGVLNKSQRGKHKKGSDIEVFVGPSGSTKGLVAEFGSATQQPQPYMRPAWEGGKIKALDDFKDALADRIQKTATRIAKRRAKALKP